MFGGLPFLSFFSIFGLSELKYLILNSVHVRTATQTLRPKVSSHLVRAISWETENMNYLCNWAKMLYLSLLKRQELKSASTCSCGG